MVRGGAAAPARCPRARRGARDPVRRLLPRHVQVQPRAPGRPDRLSAAAAPLPRPHLRRERLDERLLDSRVARGRRTTCSDAADLSSYWAPTLYVAGVPVKPLDVTIYYRRLTTAPVAAVPARPRDGRRELTRRDSPEPERDPVVLRRPEERVLRADAARRQASGPPAVSRAARRRRTSSSRSTSRTARTARPTSADHREPHGLLEERPLPGVAPARGSGDLADPALPGGDEPERVPVLGRRSTRATPTSWTAGRPARSTASSQSCLNHYSGCGPQATGALDTG